MKTITVKIDYEFPNDIAIQGIHEALDKQFPDAIKKVEEIVDIKSPEAIDEIIDSAKIVDDLKVWKLAYIMLMKKFINESSLNDLKYGNTEVNSHAGRIADGLLKTYADKKTKFLEQIKDDK